MTERGDIQELWNAVNDLKKYTNELAERVEKIIATLNDRLRAETGNPGAGFDI